MFDLPRKKGGGAQAEKQARGLFPLPSLPSFRNSETQSQRKEKDAVCPRKKKTHLNFFQIHYSDSISPRFTNLFSALTQSSCKCFFEKKKKFHQPELQNKPPSDLPPCAIFDFSSLPPFLYISII